MNSARPTVVLSMHRTGLSMLRWQADLIAEFESRVNRTVVDYEHQTLLAAHNGQPAPAAGWFGKLEWRESGLFAVDVEWTDRASQMIEAGEYRYISPVLLTTKRTGQSNDF